MAGNVHPLRSVEDEASEWVARVERGCMAEERERLEAWLTADPGHRAVFEEMSGQWRRLSNTARVAGELNHPLSAADGMPQRWRLARRGYLGWGIAAAVLIALSGVFLIAELFSGRDIYVTEVGAHKTVTLADDSTVDLNTATRVEVQFSRKQRLIRLSSGEAMFKVAHDPGRPFMVVAGSSVVRAVGTAFAVRIADGHTNVVVTEGRVVVSPLQSPLSETAQQLKAGEQVSISTAIGRIARIEPGDFNRSFAWRRGSLNIQNQPLGEVIAEVERYTTTRFRLADPALNGIKVSGYFKATDIEAFLTLLEGQFPIHAERARAGLIVLHRKIP